MNEKLRYIIFDLDGTLYEKQSVVEFYLKEFADKEGYNFCKIHEIFTSAYIESKKGNYESPAQFWSKVHEIFIKNINSNKRAFLDKLAEEAKEKILLSIKPRPYLKELANKIKDSGMKIIVFTGSNNMYEVIRLKKSNEEYNKLLQFKNKQLEILEFSQFTDKLILTNKFGGYKPQKFVFERLLAELKIAPSECIMIGDRYNDIGATQIGIFSILIGEENSKEFKPDLRISNFKELIDIIDFQECRIKSLDQFASPENLFA